MRKTLVFSILLSLSVAAKPWSTAHLTDEQAAAHLLSRFSFGARPGQVEEVAREGPQQWFDHQLLGIDPEPELEEKLDDLASLKMSDEERLQRYLSDTEIEKRSGLAPLEPDATAEQRKAHYAEIRAFREQEDLHTFGDLRRELVAQRLLSCVYARNQLWEVMTCFWFNHFNVSYASNARVNTLSYEREAVKPNALGRFTNLLLDTGKHPAMLLYLNNAQSVANSDQPTLTTPLEKRRKTMAGLNENYAREVMELHTLGVDGGYTQADVTELARCLTGWTVYPTNPGGQKLRDRLAEGKLPRALRQGLFLFRGDQHDAGIKRVLNRTFGPDQGLEEGEAALRMLASHPSTARYLSRELAVHFVSDDPPPELVERLAKDFVRSGGDIRSWLRTLENSPEFWSPEAREAKVKSPLELVASSLRCLDADLTSQADLYSWLDRMGQPLYQCGPPTGFGDSARTWVNSTTLIQRFNFATALVHGKIKGISLPALGQTDLDRLVAELLPGRDTAKTRELVLKRLPERLRQGSAESVETLGLLLETPQFQRR
ncbi:DUF1800 domain-containing protein [bacterium]|nr:DUF1800 domain-containing protein [bacterium]